MPAALLDVDGTLVDSNYHHAVAWFRALRAPGARHGTADLPSHPILRGAAMPPRGVKKGTKRARQYEHIKESEQEQGRSESRAEEIAARTVNKEKARHGESRTRSRPSGQ